MSPLGPLYMEHLTRRDVALLARVARVPPDRLAADPDLVPALAESEPVFQALFGAVRGDPPALSSPVLTFAALVGRARRDLDRATFVPEWVAPGRSVPLFDVARVRGFLDDPLRRLFLVELLASYTRVASGSSWRRTHRGWRRQRWSELDPVALAQLLDGATEAERPAILRRLGDAALFLTGVFPDHAGGRLFTGPRLERLQRTVLGWDPGAAAPSSTGGGIGLLEHVGRRAYRVAADRLPDPGAGMGPVLAALPDRFGEARRFLNVLAHRYLHPFPDRWFPAPAR